MMQGLRQSMAWLHTWVGISLGFLAYAIFLFGTVAVFQRDIDRWMQPGENISRSAVPDINRAIEYLNRHAAGAKQWLISVPDYGSAEPIVVQWHPSLRCQGACTVDIDPSTGAELDRRRTAGSEFLHALHYELYYIPWQFAHYVTATAAAIMLVAILSGVVVHRRIFSDFFRLRLNKGQRSWLDAHNFFGVLALPFHLMITYTGLVALPFFFIPWALWTHFPNEGAFDEAARPQVEEHIEVASLSSNLPAFDRMLADADRVWRGGKPHMIQIAKPGASDSVVEMSRESDALGREFPSITFDGATGARVAVSQSPKAATATASVMVQLHTAHYAGRALRWLYFLSGLGGTAMIATGLVLWTVKRHEKLPDPARPHFGIRLVQRLNIGVLAGAPAGLAVYFLANRLLPLDIAHRRELEINCLFIAWGALFVWTLARPAKRAWIEALAACAALYALVPVVSAFTTTRGLIPSLLARDWVFVGFDSVMLAMAGISAFAAWKVATHKVRTAPRRKARDLVEAAT